jgi:ketosteroid isomerase-like protein
VTSNRAISKDAQSRKALGAARRGFVAAMRKSDGVGLARHYAKNAIVIPQRPGICRGRGSIQKAFVGWLTSAKIREFDVTTWDVRVLGETAYAVGRYRLVTEDSRGSVVRDRGRFLIVYERTRQGDWLISRDMSTSDRR